MTVARLVLRAVRLRRQLPRHDDADRGVEAERRHASGEVETVTLVGHGSAGPLAAARASSAGRGRRRGRARRRSAAAFPDRRPVDRRVAGWGLAILLLLPHVTLVLISLVPRNTWTTEALPPVLRLVQLRRARRRSASACGRSSTRSGWPRGDRGRARCSASRPRTWRWRVRGQLGAALEALIALPWALPGTVFAVALAADVLRPRPWAGRFVLVGTLAILPLAYLVRGLPLDRPGRVRGAAADGSRVAGGRGVARRLTHAATSSASCSRRSAPRSRPARASRSFRASATSSSRSSSTPTRRGPSRSRSSRSCACRRSASPRPTACS